MEGCADERRSGMRLGQVPPLSFLDGCSSGRATSVDFVLCTVHQVSDVYCLSQAWHDSLATREFGRLHVRSPCNDKTTTGPSSLVDLTSESYTRGTHSFSQVIHERSWAKVPGTAGGDESVFVRESGVWELRRPAGG